MNRRKEATAITHLKKGKWSEPNLQGIMFDVKLQGFTHWYWWSFFFNRSDFGMKATFILDRKRQHFGMDSHNWKHLATLPLDRPGHRLAKGGRVPVFRLKMKRRNSCYTNLLNLRMRCKGYASFWQNVAGPNFHQNEGNGYLQND